MTSIRICNYLDIGFPLPSKLLLTNKAFFFHCFKENFDGSITDKKD